MAGLRKGTRNLALPVTLFLRHLLQVSTKPTRVLLVSDPQVQLPSILRQETVWLSTLRQFIFELNLKKSWHVTKRLRPHVVIFLGDMLASGKSVNDETE